MFNKNNPRFFFDFDDTLVKTSDCYLIVKDIRDNSERRMDPHDFYEYELKPHERLDYCLFNQEVRKPILCRNIWNIFVTKIKVYGPGTVSILTARDDPRPVTSFLRRQKDLKDYWQNIKVNAVGIYDEKVNTTDINAENKKKHIESCLLRDRTIDYVEFYDDNMKNLQQVNLLKNKFKNQVKIRTILVE